MSTHPRPTPAAASGTRLLPTLYAVAAAGCLAAGSLQAQPGKALKNEHAPEKLKVVRPDRQVLHGNSGAKSRCVSYLSTFDGLTRLGFQSVESRLPIAVRELTQQLAALSDLALLPQVFGSVPEQLGIGRFRGEGHLVTLVRQPPVPFLPH